jgi:ABC-type nickel/cobalt efflux system permease component RcnA
VLVARRILPILLALLSPVVLAFSARPAAAHPEGLPGIVRLTVDGPTIDAEWVLAGDDAAALARKLDAGRAGFGAYFHGRFTLTADGRACSATGQSGAGDAAARAAFQCERPPGTLTATSRLLLDVDQRYRTLVVLLRADHSERRFLGQDGPTTTFAVNDDVGRAEALTKDAAPPVRNLPSLERRFIAVLDGPLSIWALLFAVAGAFIVGAVHALSPGHGKSIVAAYLVGANGTRVDALLLGGAVALMHTGSVLALGFATWYATSSVAPGDVVDGLRVVTAVFVLAVGAYLVVTRTRAWRHAAQHEHGHAHAHDHSHSHGHADEATPFSRRGLIALALSGGLLPSPSALVVLLAGLSAGRLLLALGLVAVFSVGLAASIAGAGMAVLRGRQLLGVRAGQWLPLAAAYAVLAGGLVLSASAVSKL